MVPVSMRALVQRVNRVLRTNYRVLKATRGDRWRRDLGDYFVIDQNRNFIVNTHIDPEALGRELKVLRDYERLVLA